MNYKIEQGSEEINSTGGISLAGKILGKLNLFGKFNDMTMPKVKKGKISHGNILKSMVGLFCLGKTDYCDIELKKNDTVFKESLNLEHIPSEETLRQRIDDAGEVITGEVVSENLKLLRQVKDYGMETTQFCTYTPVSLDVTPFDNSGSRKEKVGRTYKGHDGYAPMMAYVGTHGYVLNCELRPGTQHSQKGTGKFLSETISLGRELGIDNALFVLDSAHDAAENIDIFNENDCSFLIKRNLRKESCEQWLETAKSCGESSEPRPGKKVYTGVVSHIKPEKCKSTAPLFLAFEVIERTIDKKGNPLLIAEIEVNSWWTNIPEAPETVIQLYHNHGTSEQFHSEFKTDMGVEKLASGKFSSNALLLHLAMTAFNILRIIGQRALALTHFLPGTFNVERRRLRSVMQDLIYIACKRVTHSNRTWLKFGKVSPWFRVFREIYSSI
jgi:hypothetical protein